MANRSITHRNFIRGTLAIAVATVILYTDSVDWSANSSQNHLNSTISSYLFSVVFALSPYGILSK